MKTAELYYDFSSPNAYFATLLLPDVVKRAGATLAYRPFLLGGLFKALGTVEAPGTTSPEKARASLRDLERWSARHDIPFAFPSRFPLNTVKALRLALVASELGIDERALTERLFRAYWAEDRDLSDPSVLAALLEELGADAAGALARIEQPDVKDRLRAATEDARAKGVFGAPVIIVEGELFFGKDRLDFVEEELRR